MRFLKYLIYEAETINTDCREERGITVGLLDGLIAQIRILRDRDTDHKDVIEVFKDLADDEDFEWLCKKVNDHKK